MTVNGKECNIDDMTPEQKCFVGTHIKMTYLNAIYIGKAVFTPKKPLPDIREVFPEEYGGQKDDQLITY